MASIPGFRPAAGGSARAQLVTAPPPEWLRPAYGRKLVVLGADGFIGSWVVRMGLAAGATVVALCVKQPWRLAGLADERLRCEEMPGGRWWQPAQHDVLARVLDGSGALVHLAYEPPATALDHAGRRRHEYDVNAKAAARIGTLAAAAGARTVFASSADVYGPWHDDIVDEQTQAAPKTPYAEGKLIAERLLLEHAGALCLRLATVFGPGELGPRAIPAFVRALASAQPATVHGDGLDLRDYVGVVEIAAAIINATATDVAMAPVLNLGSGVGRTTSSVLEAVARALDVDPCARFVASSRAPSRLIVDPSAAGRALGFAAAPDFVAAIAREARWLLRERTRWP